MYRIDQSSADSQLRLGDLYRTIENYDQATECYFKAHKLGADEAQVQLAYLFYKRGNGKLAACFAYQHPSPRAKQVLARCLESPGIRTLFEETPRDEPDLDESLLLSVLGRPNKGAAGHQYHWFFFAQ